jgi:hypothetical protein
MDDASTSEDSLAQKPDQMEVHHHPDLYHKKKKGKEYLLEFGMIFLAVTLGFFAESLREHISEKDRARKFGQLLIADFRTDTSSISQLIHFTEEKIRYIDSLDPQIHASNSKANDSCLYRTLLILISTFQLDNVNGTYEQIRNSGSMRFFDQSLINDLNSYDATSLKLNLMEDLENKFLFEKVYSQTGEMLNYKVFNDVRHELPIRHEMYLRDMNETNIDILLNEAETIKQLRLRQLNQQKILLVKAEKIISALEDK